MLITTRHYFQQHFCRQGSPFIQILGNSPLPPIPAISISADRRTLFVARPGNGGELSSYDISGPDPVLINSLSGSYSNALPSPDGQYLYYVTRNGNTSVLNQAHLPSLSPFRTASTWRSLGATAVGPNGSVYQGFASTTVVSGPLPAFFGIYDPALRLVGEMEPGRLLPTVFQSYPNDVGSVVFDNTGNHLFARVSSHYGEEVWIFSTALAASSLPAAPTKNLLNISTRGRVDTGENAMIGGFIIEGNKPKKILIRGIGPSLPITGAMDNPVLQLYDSTGRWLAGNDDWTSNRLNVVATARPPSSARESTLLVTLQPGAYTTIVRDFRNQPGLGLVEIDDLDPKNSRLANISTRGKVGTGDANSRAPTLLPSIYVFN